MTYQVYILESHKTGRNYIGMTSDIPTRLRFHNLGLNASTENGRPWRVIWESEEYDSKTEATNMEKRLKKLGATRFMKDQTLLDKI